MQDVDKGRHAEDVLWRYYIGRSDDEDYCIERRRTTIGAEGLLSMSFGPGQLSEVSFDLLDSTQLSATVHAQHLHGGSAEDLKTAIHVVEVDPQAPRYHLIVRFGRRLEHGTVVWTVRYRWPALWRPLRTTGVDAGQLNIGGTVDVRSASAELVAPAAEFHDLQLIPASQFGTVTRESSNEHVRILWRVDQPLSALRFDVRSARQAIRAP